ncbi:MAG: RdgB/HAM1 family non-canonical purine NTP pyrophosphatase [bacterium]
MKILLATRNEGKLREIRQILADPRIEWLSLRDYPSCPEARESADTYLENAREKARLAAEHSGLWALADDSGLEVEALGWRPGVRSARFAGPAADDRANNRRLLEELSEVPPERRRAVFRCVLVLRSPQGQELSAEGELWGKIAAEARGEGGFGYDPLFCLESGSCLAELSPEEKNRISHRTRALENLKPHLLHLL